MRKGPFVCLCIFGVALAGCETDNNGMPTWATSATPVAVTGTETPVALAGSETPPATFTVQDPTDVKYYRSDEPLKLALEHFNRGHFGIAARYFEDAVTKAPKDATAWVGLAASYDRIGRFDLADRAYKHFFFHDTVTTEILNNQ